MGMSVDDFHKKIQEVVTPEYIAEGERKYKILQDWINSKRPITTQKKKNEDRQELILSENECFVPCFNPDEPFRNEMPNHWFISNKSNLVTVIGENVYWLKPHLYNRGLRSSYKLKKSPITGKKSSVMAHNLLWAVFNRDCIFGRAGDYINRFGTFAFGVKNDPFNVEGHHKERIEDYPEKVNDPFDIQVMTVFAHEVLRKIRHVQDEIQIETSEEKKVGLRNELVRLVAKLSDIEAPGKGVVVNNGERYDKAGNYKDNKGSYDYGYLADKVSVKEWYIRVHFFPDTDAATKEWIVQNITDNQGRLAAKVDQVLKEQNMPYGTFTVLPYAIYDVPVCNLMITHMRPAADVN